jgi:hypothetical protein
MIDEVFPIVPRVVAANASTPAPEPPTGETSLPAPTAEQAQTADRVFGASSPIQPISHVFGIAASILLLRDIAVDTFDTSSDEEEEKAEQPSGTDKDADCTD